MSSARTQDRNHEYGPVPMMYLAFVHLSPLRLVPEWEEAVDNCPAVRAVLVLGFQLSYFPPKTAASLTTPAS